MIYSGNCKNDARCKRSKIRHENVGSLSFFLSFSLAHSLYLSASQTPWESDMNNFSSFGFYSEPKAPEPNFNTISPLLKHLFPSFGFCQKNAQSLANSTSLGTHTDTQTHKNDLITMARKLYFNIFIFHNRISHIVPFFL